MSRSGPDWLFARSATGQIRRGENDKDLKSISRPRAFEDDIALLCGKDAARSGQDARPPESAARDKSVSYFPVFLIRFLSLLE